VTESTGGLYRRDVLAGAALSGAVSCAGCADAFRTRPENPPDRDVSPSSLPNPWQQVSIAWWSNIPSVARLDIVFASAHDDRRLVAELPNNRTLRRAVPRDTDSVVLEFDGEDPVIGEVTFRLQGATDHDLTLRFSDDLKVAVL